MTSKKGPQYIAASAVCIGAFGIGTIIGYTGTGESKLRNGDLNGVALDSANMRLLGSLMCLAGCITCVPMGVFCDMIGRKPAMLIACIPYILGWILMIAAQNVPMLLIGRFLSGLGGCSFCVACPMYLSEITEVEIRGRLGNFFQLFITIGILFAYITGAYLDIRVHNIFCACIPVAFVLVFIFQPESPYYSVKKGRLEQAEKALKRLRGQDFDVSDELKSIEDKVNAEKELKTEYMKNLKKPNCKKAFIICMALMFYQQLSGINAVMFYTSFIFASAGSTIEPHISSIIIGIVQVFATIFAVYIVERSGRKALLIVSELLMALGTFLLGVYYMLNDHQMISKSTLKTLGFLPVLSLVIFIIAFSVGLGPIPWAIPGELLIPEIRGRTIGILGCFNWLLAFLMTYLYPYVQEKIGGDIVFYVFTAISASGAFFTLIYIPEPRGKTLDQMQVLLGAKE